MFPLEFLPPRTPCTQPWPDRGPIKPLQLQQDPGSAHCPAPSDGASGFKQPDSIELMQFHWTPPEAYSGGYQVASTHYYTTVCPLSPGVERPPGLPQGRRLIVCDAYWLGITNHLKFAAPETVPIPRSHPDVVLYDANQILEDPHTAPPR